jgi:hypothetical protein
MKLALRRNVADQKARPPAPVGAAHLPELLSVTRSLTLVGATHSPKLLHVARSLTLARGVAAAGGCRAR